VDLDKRLAELESIAPNGICDAVKEVRRAIDYVFHEQATGDDSPAKYSAVESALFDLNLALGELKKLPEKVEL
jgi:hypothetical protein